MMLRQEYVDQLEHWALTSGLRILGILALALIALRVARFIAQKACRILMWRHGDAETQRRAETLTGFMRYVMVFTISTIATMTIMTELGVKIGPILAGAGIVGLAVGFGAQNLVQDVISGFFILVEDQIRVGDIVEIKGKAGTVERVGLRMTVLRDVNGNVHYLRNGQIDIVTNTTKGFSQAVFDVRVSYKANIDDVIRVLKEIDEDMRRDPAFKTFMLKPLEVLGVDQLTENAMVVRARIMTEPLKQGDVTREFNRRLKRKFDEQLIPLAVRVV